MSDINGSGDGAMSIKIGGEILKVYADEGPEYIMRMANYINYIISEFNSKKGHSVRQNILLVYACLELCNALFKERDNKMTPDERNYEKMFQMELKNHKTTQEQLEAAQKRLSGTERELASMRKDLDEFVNMYDAEMKAESEKAESEKAESEKASKEDV